MYFLGASLIGDSSSYDIPISNVSNIKTTIVQNGFYDIFTATIDLLKYDMGIEYPTEWSNNTIYIAEFNDTTAAGAVDIDIHNVTDMLVKRRKVSDSTTAHNWIVIFHQDLSEMDEDSKITALNTMQIDPTNINSAQYEYAIIPVVNGIQVNAVSQTVKSEFTGIYIMEADEFWGTIVTDAFINTTRNIAKTFQTTLNYRYPKGISNEVVNYDTGSTSGEFLPFDHNTCILQTEDDVRVPYQRRFMDFLTDYKMKILKSFDGRIWLIDINPSPTDNADGMYNRRIISFNWTEIGSVESQYDMYYAGFYKVPEIYWEG